MQNDAECCAFAEAVMSQTSVLLEEIDDLYTFEKAGSCAPSSSIHCFDFMSWTTYQAEQMLNFFAASALATESRLLKAHVPFSSSRFPLTSWFFRSCCSFAPSGLGAKAGRIVFYGSPRFTASWRSNVFLNWDSGFVSPNSLRQR